MIETQGIEYDGKLINVFTASVTKYWKNGDSVKLTNGLSDAGTNSIF